MDITYRILGSDGKEYGPVTQTQLQSWIAEGRILADTQISRNDDGPWRQASQFVELIWPASASTPPPTLSSPSAAMMQPEIAGALQRQISSGAGWFYWIAGLSAVNCISALAGSSWRFVIGLSVTSLFNALGVQAGAAIIAIVLNVVVLSAFASFGVFANKGHVWAFIVGMVIYALDTALSLLFQDWINLAFHIFALWGLFSGLKAALALRKLATCP